jgi:hypothetical protein
VKVARLLDGARFIGIRGVARAVWYVDGLEIPYTGNQIMTEPFTEALLTTGPLEGVRAPTRPGQACAGPDYPSRPESPSTNLAMPE